MKKDPYFKFITGIVLGSILLAFVSLQAGHSVSPAASAVSSPASKVAR